MLFNARAWPEFWRTANAGVRTDRPVRAPQGVILDRKDFGGEGGPTALDGLQRKRIASVTVIS